MKDITELLKGVLEGCVLKILSEKETYGYEITKELNNLGFEDVVEGTVYTILLRCEKNGWVDFEKKPSKLGPPRKFYTLSKKGHEELNLFFKKWEFVSSKIEQLRER